MSTSETGLELQPCTIGMGINILRLEMVMELLHATLYIAVAIAVNEIVSKDYIRYCSNK